MRKDFYGNEIPKGIKNAINYGLSLIIFLAIFLIPTQTYSDLTNMQVFMCVGVAMFISIVIKGIYVGVGKAYEHSHSVWFDVVGELIFTAIVGAIAFILTTEIL